MVTKGCGAPRCRDTLRAQQPGCTWSSRPCAKGGWMLFWPCRTWDGGTWVAGGGSGASSRTLISKQQSRSSVIRIPRRRISSCGVCGEKGSVKSAVILGVTWGTYRGTVMRHRKPGLRVTTDAGNS
eukprot:3809617-Rhodomonas_salina.1